jgi:DNA phosphorothioation-dependent restriction protein DptG
MFKVLSTSFNELDQHFNKIVLQTLKRGSVLFTQHNYKLTVDILDANQPIINEIKRRGVMFDRNKP